jgi:hypothetical protein
LKNALYNLDKLLGKVFRENKKLNLELESAFSEIASLRSMQDDMSAKHKSKDRSKSWSFSQDYGVDVYEWDRGSMDFLGLYEKVFFLIGIPWGQSYPYIYMPLLSYYTLIVTTYWISFLFLSQSLLVLTGFVT